VEVVELWDKVAWWAKFKMNFFKKAWLASWIKERAQNFLSQIRSQSVLWISSTSNVITLLSQDNQSGYGVVHHA
jgi:hypothetical protein